jgi:TolA-binding protein
VSNLFAELRERKRPFGEALRRFFGIRRGIRRLAVAFSLFLSLNLAMALSLPPVKQWWSRMLQPTVNPVHGSKQVIAPPAPSAAVFPAPAPAIEPSVEHAPGLEAPAPSRPRRQVHAPIAAREEMVEPPAPAPIAADPEPRNESLAGESQLLSKALTALSEGQPNRALAALAIYQEKFPHGSMAYEAALAQVKAEMASNQVGRALAALDRAMAMPGFEGLPRSSELTLMRAELLAQSRRCAEALPTFDRLAGSTPGSSDFDSSLVERALYGRASCLASEGDAAGSRASLHDYLRRFPSGRFAKEARTALAGH